MTSIPISAKIDRTPYLLARHASELRLTGQASHARRSVATRPWPFACLLQRSGQAFRGKVRGRTQGTESPDTGVAGPAGTGWSSVLALPRSRS
jgi:hypothetical protein